MDLVYAHNQRVFSNMVQQLVNQNLMKVTNNLRGLTNQIQPNYKKCIDSYRNNVQITSILFDKYKQHFEESEWTAEGSLVCNIVDDSFIMEQRYLSNTRSIMNDLSQLRDMLITLWQQAQEID